MVSDLMKREREAASKRAKGLNLGIGRVEVIEI
jgi:hypothetical protein